MIRDVFYYGKKPNAHPREKFATSFQDAKRQNTTEHFWIINEFCDYTNFDWDYDFDFLPDEEVWTQDHINIWPSFHQKDSGTWLCAENCTEVKIYKSNVNPLKRKNEISSNWVLLENIDHTKFDFSWHPDPTDPPYIYKWGCKFFPVEIQHVLEYHVEGATETKYMDRIVELLPNNYWVENQLVDKSKFDMTWRPSPLDKTPYIYVWGNKHVSGTLKSTLEYHTPGATQIKHMPERLEVLPEYDRWKVYADVDKDKFDFSWRPDPTSPPYIYVWGNKWVPGEIKPTLEYHCPGATQYKYMEQKVDLLPCMNNFEILHDIDKNSFDFSWRPNPTEPPYIYVFGNQWYSSNIMPTLLYKVENATEYKYVNDIIVRLAQRPDKFKTLIPVRDFDYSWVPNPHDPSFIYVFGNKWNDSATEPTIEYHVNGATDYKYINDLVATPEIDMSYWTVNNNEDFNSFDFSWRPNPHSPPQIYQWEDNGPCYSVPGATDVVLMKRNNNERKVVNTYKIITTLDDLIKEHIDEVFWAINPDLNYDKFDFSWRPTTENFRHINVFGNEYSKNTQTYYVNGPMYKLGHREFNYVEDQQVPIDSSSLDMFFVDKGNEYSQDRYEQLKEKIPQLQKTRYLNTWVDTITRCCNKSATKFFWVLSSELDYSDFTFDFYPSPWQEKMVHVFGTQWSHWGNTYLINKESFVNDTKYVKIIEHLNILNFVKTKKAKAADRLYDVIYIDHGNMTDIEGKTIVKYKDNYLTTFKEILKLLPIKKEHYIWVVSSICDYTTFDFTYICDPFAKEQLHVFPSNNQKFGDTFLINVNMLRKLVDNMSLLEDYNKINFNQHQRVSRLPAPIIVSDDTHTSNLKEDYNFPYAIYITKDNEQLKNVVDIEPLSLWKDNKDILVTSDGGTRIVAPKEVSKHVKTELYDYPYIKKTSKLFSSNPLDIVFFSNGEAGADDNYEHLIKLTSGLKNRVIRIDGVQGRVASQHAAANTSQTPWYFLVNAKLKVNEKFDFSWQPDRLQIPKHYIFLATNPVNGLEYGHQAIVANNKTLTLNTNARGLDFTMDSEHEIVSVNSGIGVFNTSPWDTWRTSFREVIKLRHSNTEENKTRLNAWLNIADGNFSEFSLYGAKDAIEYYDSVNGNFDKLKLSYDWPWLKEQFDKKYK